MPAQAKLQNPPRNKSSFMEFGEAFTIVQDLAEFYRVLSATNADAILELAIVTADSGSPAKLETQDRPEMSFFFEPGHGASPSICVGS